MNIRTFYSKLIDQTAKMYHKLENIDSLNDMLFQCEGYEEGKIEDILEGIHSALDVIRETANSLEMDIEDRQKGGKYGKGKFIL